MDIVRRAYQVGRREGAQTSAFERFDMLMELAYVRSFHNFSRRQVFRQILDELKDDLDRLTTAVTPPGSGTITPASGTYYNADTTVTLTIAPTGDLSFPSWTRPVTPTGLLTGTVVMSAPVSVTASFGTATQPTSTISALLNSAS